jgi:hypothetical protein
MQQMLMSALFDKGRLAIKPSNKDNGHAIVNEPEFYIEDILNYMKEIGFVISKVALPEMM